MDQKHRALIHDNLEKLVDVTDNLNAILETLLVQKVINAYMCDRILSIDDRKGKIRSFYLLMTCRGPSAYKNLRECLRSTQNIEAVKLLEAYKEIERSYANGDVDILENDDENVPAYAKNTASANDITIHPDRKFMDIEEDNLPNGVYRMRSKPRGFALLVNIKNCRGMEPRIGSEIDYKKMDELFKGLGYKVDPHVDLDKKQLEKTVKQFSENPSLAKVDSLVVFIMSHGFLKKVNNTCIELCTSDGSFVNTEWIIQHVVNSPCFITSSSRRKPKIFFFQACSENVMQLHECICTLQFSLCLRSFVISNKGNKEDTGRVYDEKLAIDSISHEVVPHQGTRSRTYEDVIIIYSTVNHHHSIRDPKKGAWFVNLFFNIVSKNACFYDLETMIGQVDEEIRRMKSDRGFQSIGVDKRGLFKKVFFNPGLYEDDTDGVCNSYEPLSCLCL